MKIRLIMYGAVVRWLDPAATVVVLQLLTI